MEIHGMLDADAILLKHICILVQMAAPIWVTQASMLVDLFMQSTFLEELLRKVSVLTHDAAEPGVGYNELDGDTRM
jgi:hypothetical protein